MYDKSAAWIRSLPLGHVLVPACYCHKSPVRRPLENPSKVLSVYYLTPTEPPLPKKATHAILICWVARSVWIDLPVALSILYFACRKFFASFPSYLHGRHGRCQRGGGGGLSVAVGRLGGLPPKKVKAAWVFFVPRSDFDFGVGVVPFQWWAAQKKNHALCGWGASILVN